MSEHEARAVAGEAWYQYALAHRLIEQTGGDGR